MTTSEGAHGGIRIIIFTLVHLTSRHQNYIHVSTNCIIIYKLWFALALGIKIIPNIYISLEAWCFMEGCEKLVKIFTLDRFICGVSGGITCILCLSCCLNLSIIIGRFSRTTIPYLQQGWLHICLFLQLWAHGLRFASKRFSVEKGISRYVYAKIYHRDLQAPTHAQKFKLGLSCKKVKVKQKVVCTTTLF